MPGPRVNQAASSAKSPGGPRGTRNYGD